MKTKNGYQDFGRTAIKKNTTATVYTETGSIALVIQSVKREGDKLVVDGKALGTMSMDMIFTLEEIFNALKIAFCWGVISFILLLPYFSLTHAFKRLNKRGDVKDVKFGKRRNKWKNMM